MMVYFTSKKKLFSVTLCKYYVQVNDIILTPSTENSYFITKIIGEPMDTIIDVLFGSNAFTIVTLTGVIRVSWIGKVKKIKPPRPGVIKSTGSPRGGIQTSSPGLPV